MNSIPPQGPTIPSSTNFLSNFTRLLKVTDNLRGDLFSSPNPTIPNTNTTLSGGILANLNNPILNSQGATYAYAQAGGGSGNPGGPIKSIQYNNSGSFGGSSTLTFDKITNTLTLNKLSNGTVLLGSGTISGLIDPTTGQEAATKKYVDNFGGLTITSINTVGPTTYNALDLVNGIIYRDTQTSGTTTDILPTAAQIIAASGGIVGTTLKFSIKNVNSDYTNVITFTVGTGITFGNSQNIFAGYQYNGIMIINNVTSGLEAITLYTINNGRTNNVNWETEIGGLASIVKTVRIKDFYAIFNNTSNVTSSPILSTSNVSGKINIVNSNLPVFVKVDKPEIMAGLLSNSSFISGPFLWKSGGIDFYIINNSSTFGANVTVSGRTGSIPWTNDPNSNMIIPPGFTGWFMIYLTITNFPELSSLTAANIYTLGITPNT
jgi:hypothetical protein